MDFENAFSNFIDRREYDQAANDLFLIVRVAFLAGWKAAGGESPIPQKVIELVHKRVDYPVENHTDSKK